MTLLDSSTLREIFVRSLEAEFEGLDVALTAAESISRIVDDYSQQTRDAAKSILVRDYRLFDPIKNEGKNFKDTYPFLHFEHQEQTNPRHVVQTIEFIKLKVVQKWSTPEYAATKQYSSSYNRRFLCLTWNKPTGKILVEDVNVTKGHETKSPVLDQILPSHEKQAGKWIEAIQEEILDWIMERAPKNFIEMVVPEIGQIRAEPEPAPLDPSMR